MDANETTHAGWHIRTLTGFDNPEGWKRGDPDTYVVRGVAEFPRDGVDAFSWLSLEPLVEKSERFTDRSQAGAHHAKVADQLAQRIDALRHPDW